MARPSTGAGLSISQLEQILSTRRSKLNKLLKDRRNLERALDDVNRDIAKIGGPASNGRRGGGTRVRNERSLPDVIEEVMRKAGKAMGVGDITEAVQATGYRSNSANFRAIINQTLIKERKRFAPSGERGVYQLKKT